MLKNFRNKLLTVAAGGDGAGDVADGVVVSTAGSPGVASATATADVDVDAPVSGFICPQCRRDFSGPEALQIHFLAHLEEPAETEKPPEAAAAVVGASAGATPVSESKRGSIFKSRGSKGGQQQQRAAPTSTFYPGEEAEEFVCPMCEQRFALPDQLQVSHGCGCD